MTSQGDTWKGGRMKDRLGPATIGVLCAIPIALLAAWFATVVFDPTGTGRLDFINRTLGMGPLRNVAYALGALSAAAIVAPRLAREDVGSFGGLFLFVGLAHLIASIGVAIEITVRDPGGLDLMVLVAWPLGLLLSFGASMILWIPTGAIWVAAVRRLTVRDLPEPTALERAESERRRNEAAREHVTVDGTNLGDQGSDLWRNRG